MWHEERRLSHGLFRENPFLMHYGQTRVLLKFKWIPEIKVYFKLLDIPKKSEQCKYELSPVAKFIEYYFANSVYCI